MGKLKTPNKITLTKEQADTVWKFVSVGAATDCWPWTGSLDTKGYGRLGLNGVSYRAHRLVLASSGLFSSLPVRHLCNNTRCVNPKHLRFGTYKEQSNDQKLAGTWTHGDTHGLAKLTSEVVLKLREESNTRSQRYLARKYGISKANVYNIQQRKTWKHI